MSSRGFLCSSPVLLLYKCLSGRFFTGVGSVLGRCFCLSRHSGGRRNVAVFTCLNVGFAKFTNLSVVFWGSALAEGCWRAQTEVWKRLLGRWLCHMRSQSTVAGVLPTLGSALGAAGVRWSLSTARLEPHALVPCAFSFPPVLNVLLTATSWAWEKDGRAEPLPGKADYGPAPSMAPQWPGQGTGRCLGELSCFAALGQSPGLRTVLTRAEGAEGRKQASTRESQGRVGGCGGLARRGTGCPFLTRKTAAFTVGSFLPPSQSLLLGETCLGVRKHFPVFPLDFRKRADCQ